MKYFELNYNESTTKSNAVIRGKFTALNALIGEKEYLHFCFKKLEKKQIQSNLKERNNKG